MGRKLSALKFVRNNKKQAGVMIIALSLTFMTMYIMNFLFLTTQESFKEVFLEQPKKVVYMEISSESLGVDADSCQSEEELWEKADLARTDLMNRLKNQDGINDVFFAQCLYVSYQGIVGEMNYDMPLIEPEEIPAYLKHMDAKLIDGRLPENDGEILVDKKIYNNQNLEIGGSFDEGRYGKQFKVVGILDSDNITCVGTPQGLSNCGWYMVVLTDEDDIDMVKTLEKVGVTTTSYDSVYDVKYWKKIYKSQVTDILDGALLGILIVVMVFLAISIIVAYVSFMRNRVNEYCLYSSIGFSRGDIYGMMMREIGIIFGSSIVVGALLTIVLMLLLGHFVLDGLGLVYRYFYPEHILRIFAAFMAIVGLLQLPIIYTIHNIKTIDKVEE